MASQSGIITNGKLISQAAWEHHIDALQRECTSFDSTEKKVETALISALKKRIPSHPFGVFFSGGVDSTVIAYLCKQLCKQRTNNFTCYTVGVKGSDDLVWAQKIAAHFNLNHVYKELTFEELEETIQKVTRILTNPNNEYKLPADENLIVAVGVASVVSAAVDLAKKNSIPTFFSGLGSEEIFAGYQRHATAKEVTQECWRGLKNMWKRDLIRDYTLAKALGITVVTPFLDPEVIREAMKIPPEQKINSQNRKIILREIAQDMGIPHAYAYRPKKAAQYGSRFNDALRKLAIKNKFKYKGEYVRSLL